MQEFQVDGNLMMANTILQNVLRCSKLSYCRDIILTVKKWVSYRQSRLFENKACTKG